MKIPLMQDLGNKQVQPLTFKGLNRRELIQDQELSFGINLDSELIPAICPRKSTSIIKELSYLGDYVNVIKDFPMEIMRPDSTSVEITNKGMRINYSKMSGFNSVYLGVGDGDYYSGIPLDKKKINIEFEIEESNLWTNYVFMNIKVLDDATNKEYINANIGNGMVGKYKYTFDNLSEHIYITLMPEHTVIIGEEIYNSSGSFTISNFRITYHTDEVLEDIYSFKIVNGKQVYVEGESFYYDGIERGSLTPGKKSIVDFNGNLVIFPDKKYYDYIGNVFGDFTCPYDIEFTTVHYNRIFGIKGSEVYACKVGDFKVWDDYSGTEMDSWAADVYSDGDFTGITSYQDHVVFFKRDQMYELYGYTPSQFKIMEASKIGCIDDRSISEVGGMLFFMSEQGVQTYAGGFPREISENLNLDTLTKAAAIGDGRKYYVCIDKVVYIYDTWAGIWMPYADIDVVEFAKSDNDIYALASDGKVYQFEDGEEIVEWEAHTKKYDEGTFRKKSIRYIRLKVKMDPGAELSVYVSADERPFVLHKTIKQVDQFYRQNRETIISVPLKRASTYQLKLVGKGRTVVYGEREFVIGSDR